MTANIPKETENLFPRLFGNIVWNESAASTLQSQITLSASKLELTTSKKAALTFLVESPALITSESGEVLPAVPLSLRFDGSAIEHQVSKVPGIEDYVTSSWLVPVRYQTTETLHADLGTFQLPLFIRSFPLSPRMDLQSGTPYKPAATTLTDLTLWNYSFSYSQDFHYAQDRVYGEVAYNIQDNMFAMSAFEGVFQPLAQFIHVQTKLEELLKQHVPVIDAKTKEQTQIDTAAKVVGAYLKVVSDIVARLGDTPRFNFSSELGHLNEMGKITYEFHITEGEQTFEITTGGSHKSITAWVVTLVSKEGKPPQGMAKHPQVEMVGFKTQLATSLSDDSKGIYAFWYLKKDGKTPMMADQAQVISGRKVVFPGMQILQRQDAKASIYVRRNEQLVPPHDSNEAFIYQTSDVTFSNPLHPTLSSDQKVDIATVGSASGLPMDRSLEAHLTTLFAALLQNSHVDQVTVQMVAYYSFSLSSHLADILIPNPVIMQPPLPFSLSTSAQVGNSSSSTIAQMISILVSGIHRWLDQNQPQ